MLGDWKTYNKYGQHEQNKNKGVCVIQGGLYGCTFTPGSHLKLPNTDEALNFCKTTINYEY